MVDSAFAGVNLPGRRVCGTIADVSGGKRGPYAGTRERRTAIMAAAHALVLEQGHRATTAADVAGRAGVTESAVLYHFPTKEHLYTAVFEHLLSGPGPHEDATTVAQVEALLTRLVARDTANPHISRLYQVLMAESSDPEHPAHDTFVRRTDLITGAMARSFAGIQESGEAVLVASPERCARLLVGAWDGLQAQWFIRPDFDLAADVLAAFHAIAPAHADPGAH